MKISKNLAYSMMVFAAILWGTSGTLTKIAIDDKGATANQIALFGALFSAAILIVALGIFDRAAFRIRKKDFPGLLLFSVITGTLFSIAWYNAIDLTNVSTALILLYAYPSIVTGASVFLLGEKMTAPKAIALPVTFIGCVLVADAYDLDTIKLNIVGICLGLFTAATAGVYYIWGKKFLSVYSSTTMILYMTILMIPGLLILLNPLTILDNPLTADAWLFILLIALFPGTLGFAISMFALKRIEASKASIIACIELPAGILLAMLIISEEVNGFQALGIVLVIGAVLMLRVTQREEEDIVESPPAR